MQTNIGLFLAKRARLEPNKIGLICEGREITYKDWNERPTAWPMPSSGLM